jgi:hypothetical protein
MAMVGLAANPLGAPPGRPRSTSSDRRRQCWKASMQVSSGLTAHGKARDQRASHLRLLARQLVQGVAPRGGSLGTVGATPLQTERRSRLMSHLKTAGRLASIRMAERPLRAVQNLRPPSPWTRTGPSPYPGDRNCRRGSDSIRGHGAGHSWHLDCQVDCQPFELALFSLDRGGLAQAVYMHRWTAADGDGQAGKSYESSGQEVLHAG